MLPPSEVVTNVPGTPLTSNWNSGANPVSLFEGGGIGVQPLFLPFYPNSYSFTAMPGDVVFLLNAQGGNNRTNWAAVVNFFNPSDPNGAQGLAATEYQTYFPTNPSPGYFATVPLFPHVVYVPIARTVTNVGVIAYYDETGPVGGILSGQTGAFELAAAIQPVSSAPVLTVSHSGQQFVVSWPAAVSGWQLQTNRNLSTGTWGNYAGAIINNSVTNPPPQGDLFFRLRKP